MALSDAFYLEILEEVNSVLAELGTTYSVRGASAYDPDALERVPAVARDVIGLIANQQLASALGPIAFPVTETSAGWIGKKTLLLTADSAPSAGEEVQVDGQWFPLSKVVEVKPADITVLYMLDVTR